MEDLISRQAAIDKMIWYDDEEYMHPGFIKTEHAIKILEGLPPAQRWIPFSMHKPDAEEKELHPGYEYILDGKLPENRQRILVNIKCHGHEKVQVDEYYDDDECYLDSGYEIGAEATHWMPLPEPYKEVGT